LKGTKDRGLILSPDPEKGIQCYVDASFAGDYCSELAEDPSTLYSRTGYAIMYCGCPILWVSKLQTEITLSTTESEYVALSQAMRDVIPFLNLMKELSSIMEMEIPKAKVKCTLFEDNNGALELARTPRYRPRTKHIALKYHHFREHVKRGLVSIMPIDTKEQIADQFTKALDLTTFQYLRKKLMGW
jgi:ATP-dependent nuclease, subunit B